MKELEKDWITEAGLRAVVLFVNNSHRCGYVQLPHNHFLNGINYSESTPLLEKAYNKAIEGTLGKRGPILILLASGDKLRMTPNMVFDVHGGITYSDGFSSRPVPSDNWWYGFDCAHLGDRTKYNDDGEFRSVEYVAAECESLAKQIKDLDNDY